jgi:uroporphyrinogen-III synthase
MKRVLCTVALSGTDRQLAVRLGLQVTELPLLAVRPLWHELPPLPDAAPRVVAFTSQNAVRAWADYCRNQPLATPRTQHALHVGVGQATTAELRHALNRAVEVAQGPGPGGEALAQWLLQLPTPGPVWHPCAREARPELGQRLHARHVPYIPLVVYETTWAPTPTPLPDPAPYQAVLVASPRAVERLLQLYPAPPAHWVWVCIGPTTTAAARPHGPVLLANQPRTAALLRAAAGLATGQRHSP